MKIDRKEKKDLTSFHNTYWKRKLDGAKRDVW